MPFKEGHSKFTVLYKILRIYKFLKNTTVDKRPYIELDLPEPFISFHSFCNEYYHEAIYSQFVDEFSEAEMRINLPEEYNMYHIGFEWKKGYKSLVPTTLDDYEEYYIPYLSNLNGGLPEAKKVIKNLYNYYSTNLNTSSREKAFKQVKDFIKPIHKDHYFLCNF